MTEPKMDTKSVEFPLARDGVNLKKNINELLPTECIKAQNVIWRNGIILRDTQALFNSSQINGIASGSEDKIIRGLHRFYYGSSKLTLAAADDLSSGMNIRKSVSETSWTDIHTFSTASQPVTMNTWGALDKVYIANSTDRAAHYDGTTTVDSGTVTITLGGTGAGESFFLTINGTAIGTGGKITEAVEWTAGGSASASATALASYLNGLSGVTASASTNIVTITPAATTDIEKFAEDSVTDLSLSTHFAAPAKAIQFLPYQDRLLCIDNNNAGELRWFKSYSDSELELRSLTNVRLDTKLYGMAVHNLANVDAGQQAAILLAGASTMYLFKATDMTPTSGDYTVFPLAITSGCNAPKTIAWTPKGLMWLGTDKQVYLLPFNSIAPIPVGDKIQSFNSDIDGIESIPTGQLENACATYHDGFYKLSVAGVSSTSNNVQFWLDINRMKADDNTHVGPWYGPMSGQVINIFANMNGAGDSGELLGGEGGGTYGSGSNEERGYVYTLDNSATYKDITPTDETDKSIEADYQTFYSPLTAIEFDHMLFALEFDFLNTARTINITLKDISGIIKTGDSITLTGAAPLWGSFNWGDENWGDTQSVRRALRLSPNKELRRLSIGIISSATGVDFRMYGTRANVRQRRITYSPLA